MARHSNKAPRQRIRSRGGCIRCRSMKRKCDETRPECSQCRDQNIPCPGYKQQLRWSRKHEVFSGESPSAAPHDELVDLNATADTTISEAPNVTTPSNASASPASIAPSDHGHLASIDSTIDSTQAATAVSPSQTWGSALLHPHASLSSADHGLDDALSSIVSDPQQVSISGITLAGHSLSSQPCHSTTLTGFDGELGNSPNAFESPSTSAARCGKQQEWNMFQDRDTLVQYYFDNICYIHTTYDDPGTPFRSMVGRRLSSPLIFSCIASMCATHLFQGVEAMLPTCMQYHSSAIKTLSSAIADLDKAIEAVESPQAQASPNPANSPLRSQLEEALLASLLLGYCSPWLDPSDLGLPHLLGARKLVEQWLKVLGNTHPGIPPAALVLQDPEGSFLIGSMVYWEALLAFVIDQPLDAVDYLEPFYHDPGKVIPNSTTGVSTPIYIYLARTGICLRQQRMLHQLQTFGWRTSSMYTDLEGKINKCASELCSRVMEYVSPSSDAVLGMKTRPEVLHHMLCVCEIYRLAILLELNRGFPDLFASTPTHDHIPDSGSPSSASISDPKSQDLAQRLSGIIRAMISYFEEFPSNHESGMHQTLALIICGSALTFPRESDKNYGSPFNPRKSLDGYVQTVTMRRAVIERYRAFIKERMALNTAGFGLSDIFSRAERLVQQVWKESDEAVDSLSTYRKHWIDVMQEQKLETFLG